MRQKIADLLKVPQNFFAVFAFIFGLVFLLMIPPFKTPDESIHILRAYEVAALKSPHVGPNGETGSMLPASIQKTQIATKGVFELGKKIDLKYDHHYTKHALMDIPLNKTEQKFYVTGSLPSYNPLSYIPQAVVVAVANTFNSPVMLTVYAVRFTNLLLWIVLGYIGIRIFPWKKWAVVGIALLPSVVAQSVSPGLDVGIFASTLIFLAIIFRAIDEKKKMKLLDIFILLITATFMIIGKAVAVAFLPLVWLIKNEQYSKSSIKGLLIKIVISLLPIFIFIAWVLLSAQIASAPRVTASGANAASIQINTFIHNPLDFISMLFSTIFTNNAFSNMIATSLIGNFGFLNEPMSPVFIVLGYVYLAALFLVNIDKERVRGFRKFDKILIIFMVVGYIIGVFLAMYVSFTAPGGPHIRGVNGRYFIPVMFLLVPVVYLSWFNLSRSRYIKMVGFGAGVLFIATVGTLAHYHYL